MSQQGRRWLALALVAAALAPRLARAADGDGRIALGGVERRYSVHVPASAGAAPPALVIVLHGGGGHGRGAAKQTGFSAEADRQGFIAAYPDGSDRARPLVNLAGKPGFLTWNAGACCGYAAAHGIDDVAFLRAVIAQIARDHPIDRRRIYATGLSNGGMMAYRLACEASDLIAAVGIVAGSVVIKGCAPAQPVAVMHIHGSADENVPLAGGIGRKSLAHQLYPPVADSIALWVRADGCAAAPLQEQPAPGVSESSYSGCAAGTAVVFDLIEGGGHSWPGGERMAKFLDPPATAMAATPALWRFFAAHPKP